jgi:Coenzyme PQQ synthesis protein D (PqqD)
MTSPDTVTATSALLTSNLRVPQHVVYRSFPSETVVLNLQTGKYHGLNATAGRMLEELERASCVSEAAAALADCYNSPHEVVERDLCELCRLLLGRGLIEADGSPEP